MGLIWDFSPVILLSFDKVFLIIIWICWRIDAFKLWYWRRLLDFKEIKPVDPKWNHLWVLIGRIVAEAPICCLPGMKKLTHWKRPWCWGRLRAGGEGDDRGWDGWMQSLTQWTWIWETLGDSGGQRSLAGYSPWCCRGSDTTEQLSTYALFW